MKIGIYDAKSRLFLGHMRTKVIPSNGDEVLFFRNDGRALGAAKRTGSGVVESVLFEDGVRPAIIVGVLGEQA